MSQSVTVVVPTQGRSTLNRSIESALAEPECERVHVVFDTTEADVSRPIRDPQVTYSWTGGGHGGGAARDIATQCASSHWVAYLDDDDYFLSGKLAKQIGFATRQDLPMVACQSRFETPDGEVVAERVPARPITDSEIPSVYLFAKRSLSVDRNLLNTSTLMMRTPAAKAIGWDRSLKRHQDWAFVLGASSAGYRIAHVPEVLTAIEVPAADGISASSDWEESFRFFTERADQFESAAAADFLVGQTLRYAIAARDARGVKTVCQEARSHDLPSGHAAALAASGLLGRGTLDRLMRLRRYWPSR